MNDSQVSKICTHFDGIAMFSSFKKVVLKLAKPTNARPDQSSLLFEIFIKVFQDVLTWKKLWLSLYFIFLFNIVFIVSLYQQIKWLPFLFCLATTFVCMDAFEAWLKHKHRVSFLKTMANYNAGGQHNMLSVCDIRNWLIQRHIEFLQLRDKNHTKAYLSANMILGAIFLIGRYVNGYLLVYIISMFIFLFKIITPPVLKFAKKINQSADSDCELEGLIPDISESSIRLLSLEPENQEVTNDDKLILDWKPEEVIGDNSSDTSENSNSLVTNFLIEKSDHFEDNVETTDTSEDEYIPQERQANKLQSTLEVLPSSSNTWGTTAYNAIWNFTGAVTSILKTSTEHTSKQAIRKDSSDEFEMVDESEFK